MSILGTDRKTHTIIQAHIYRGLWLDLMVLFGSMRGTIGNLGGKALGKASAVVFFPLQMCLMEDASIVYLYNKEQGTLAGRVRFTFRIQKTTSDNEGFDSFPVHAILPFLFFFLTAKEEYDSIRENPC